MLKDLTRDDWLGFLDLPPERVPSVLVLRGTRNLRANYEKYRAHFADVLEIGSPNDLFEDIFVGQCDGVDVGYASVYGPAMASEITHLFGVLGTGLVIQTGVCGALVEGIAAGDLVVATYARCAEGAAACYLPGVLTVEATPELVAEVMADPTVAVARHADPVWMTPALLAEGEAEIEQWHGEGYIAADMETATISASPPPSACAASPSSPSSTTRVRAPISVSPRRTRTRRALPASGHARPPLRPDRAARSAPARPGVAGPRLSCPCGTYLALSAPHAPSACGAPHIAHNAHSGREADDEITERAHASDGSRRRRARSQSRHRRCVGQR